MRATAEQAEARSRRDPGDDRAQRGSGRCLLASWPAPGQPSAVPERRRPGGFAAGARSDLRRLRRAAAGGLAPRGRSSSDRHPRGVTETISAGTVTAIDLAVDAATRNVRVRATFTNAGERLRPGMFVEAGRFGAGRRSVTLPTRRSTTPLRRFGLRRRGDAGTFRPELSRRAAAGGETMFRAATRSLSFRRRRRRAGGHRESSFRPGAAVFVNNDVQPGNSAARSPRTADEIHRHSSAGWCWRRRQPRILIAGLAAIRSLRCGSSGRATSRSSR